MRAFHVLTMVALISAFPSPLWAGPGDCGVVTALGQCNQGTLTWCEAPNTAHEHVATLNCATSVFPQGITGVCTLINMAYGYDCAAALGQGCQFLNAQGQPVITYCDGASPGCILNEATNLNTCRADVGPCTPAAEGSFFAPVCSGNVLVLGCQQGQPFGTDCAALGGRCSGAVCLNVARGQNCDAQRNCAAGLSCDVATHRCVSPADTCDPVTYVGGCTGPLLSICRNSTHLKDSVDCAAAFPDAGPTTCGPQFTCLDDGGACATLGSACIGASAGAPCSVTGGVLCAAGLGCVMGLGPEGTSAESCAVTASCGRQDVHVGCAGEVATFCLGNDLVTAVEAAGFDCASLTSHCTVDPTLGPLCLGQAGARCDDLSIFPNSPFRCAPSLQCSSRGNRFGFCVTPDGGVPDAAVQDGSVMDGGGQEPPPADEPPARRCGCSTAEDGARGLTAALLGLVWLRLALRRHGAGITGT